MKTIEISTIQQVKLEYNLAPFGTRLMAFFIDTAIFWACLYFGFIFFILSGYAHDNDFNHFLLMLLLFIFIFYSFCMEFLTKGRSIGKWLMKIRIIQLNGDPPTFIQLLSRWMFRSLDFYFSYGIIAWICIDGTAFSQRLGDLIAGTVVIKTNENKDINLNEILERNTISEEIKFINATLVDEQTMLLIKQSLMHYNTNPENKAIKEAIQQLCDKLSGKLNYNFSKLTTIQIEDLNRLLRDYIQLTR